MPKDRTKLTLPLVKLEHYNRIGRLRMTDYVIDTAPDDPYGDAS